MKILYQATATASGGRDGTPIRRFAPVTRKAKMEAAIRQALAAPAK